MATHLPYQGIMNEKNKSWLKLCQRASVEEDNEKLLALVKEIIRLFDEDESYLEPRISQSFE